MSRKRTDPGTAEAPQVTAVVTVKTRERVIELATEKGLSTSAAARKLIELGIEALDEDAG